MKNSRFPNVLVLALGLLALGANSASAEEHFTGPYQDVTRAVVPDKPAAPNYKEMGESLSSCTPLYGDAECRKRLGLPASAAPVPAAPSATQKPTAPGTKVVNNNRVVAGGSKSVGSAARATGLSEAISGRGILGRGGKYFGFGIYVPITMLRGYDGFDARQAPVLGGLGLILRGEMFSMLGLPIGWQIYGGWEKGSVLTVRQVDLAKGEINEASGGNNADHLTIGAAPTIGLGPFKAFLGYAYRYRLSSATGPSDDKLVVVPSASGHAFEIGGRADLFGGSVSISALVVPGWGETFYPDSKDHPGALKLNLPSLGDRMFPGKAGDLVQTNERLILLQLRIAFFG